MSRRVNLYGLGVIFGGSLLLLFTQQLGGEPGRVRSATPQALRPPPSPPPPPPQIHVNRTLLTMDEVISLQRTRIARDMKDYRDPEGRSLDQLTPETGGKPVRNVIITTWRSGSTFLGDILNSLPANYYHYEPLLNFDIVQIRGPPHAAAALRNLKKLLDCDYSDMDDYLEYGKGHVWLFTHNERLWDQCSEHPQYCWNSTFLTRFCKLFPLQSMKVVRLRLKLAEELLGNNG